MSGRAPRKLSEAEFIGSAEARADIRLFLVFGPDESAVAEIAAKMCSSFAEDAERIDIDSDQLRKDPALLADEAGSLSLFGGARFIRLTIRREEGLEAIENLLAQERDGNPVIASAGDLKKTSKIRKLAESHPRALTHICYVPDEGKMAPLVARMAQEAGLSIDRSMAMRIAQATGQDRRLAAIEIEKLALYYDAASGNAKTVEPEDFEALCAENDEENIGMLVNRVLGGDMRMLGSELASVRQTGIDAIRIIRALQRRIAMLMGLRGKVDAGQSPDNVVNSPAIFWKEKPAIKTQLMRWPSARLARLNGHILETEKRLMQVKAELGGVILEEELTRIARAAARAR